MLSDWLSKIKWKNYILEFTPSLGLLLVAIIWGSTFSFQKRAMLYMGPFQFMGIRFGVATLFILFALYNLKIALKFKSLNKILLQPKNLKNGFILGGVVFVGHFLQQISLLYTTATNAAFITSLYVVIIPLIWFVLGVKQNAKLWIPAIMSTIGLFLLSGGSTIINYLGDSMIFVSSFVWAVHLILCGKFANKAKTYDIIVLAFWQSFVCSIFGFIVAIFLQETWQVNAFKATWLDIFLAGTISAGLANVIQIIAQKKTKDHHAAIILSMEGVFAIFAARIVLNERMEFISIIGACIIFISGIISQIMVIRSKK